MARTRGLKTIIIVSDSDSDNDEEIKPTRCLSSKNLFRMKKYIFYDSAEEKEEDSKQDDIDEGSSKSEEPMAEASTRNNYDPDKISLSSDSESSSETLLMSYALEEIGDCNIDPLIAQKRAIDVCKLEQMESDLSKLKLLLASNNIDFLPDKGGKLRENVARQEKDIRELKAELKNIPNPKTKQYSTDKFNSDNASLELPLSSNEKQRGKKARETLERESALTVDRLEDLHVSLVARPNEDEKAEDPREVWMEKNFTRRRDSSRTRDEEIYIISDSDEDTDEEIKNKEKNNEFFIDESSDVNASGEAPPTRCLSSKNLFRMKKYVFYDSAEEKEEDSKQDDVNEGSSKSEEPMAEASTRNNYDPVKISLSSDSESSSETLLMSYALEEIGDCNIDPLIAQKRAIDVCKLEQMESDLSKLKLLLASNNIDFLPDKGGKLRENVARQEKDIRELKAKLKNIPNPKTKQYSTDKFNSDNASLELPLSSNEKQRRKKAQETLERESVLTADRLEDLQVNDS